MWLNPGFRKNWNKDSLKKHLKDFLVKDDQ